jgi:hypothetical protein
MPIASPKLNCGQTPPVETSPRARLARYALIGAALLGVSADALLRIGPWGAGLVLWMAVLAGLTVALLDYRGTRLSTETCVWLAAAVLLSGTFMWRDADLMLTLVNLSAMLAALLIGAVTAAGVPELSVAQARLRDLFHAALHSVGGTAAGPCRLIAFDAELQAVLRPPGHGQLLRMGRAVLITAPLFAVFALLFTRADPLFGSLLTVPRIDMSVVMPHVIVTGFFAWIVAGWFRGVLIGDRSAGGAAPNVPSPPGIVITPPFTLGSTDVTLALGALNVLFTVFVLVQLQWLFGGEALVLRTTGLGYAEYARHGFFELTSVAALLLAVLVGGHALIPRDDSGAMRRFRRLSLPLVALLGAVMLSAAARMQLYVYYYGLSLDRLYASTFMVWLALVFVWLSLTLLRGRPRRFALGFVSSAFAVLALLNIVNPGALVARTNLARAESAAPGMAAADYLYVASLGGDAAPIVVDQLLKSAPAAGEAAPVDRCVAATSLLARWDSGSRREAEDWRRWNLARSRALAAVRTAAPRLRALCGPSL